MNQEPRNTDFDDEQPNLSDFSYRINSLPGTQKKTSPIDRILAPRNAHKLRVYLLFLAGCIFLTAISAITISDVNFYGQKTYIEYVQKYLTQGNYGYISLIIMLIVNAFWVLINVIIEFLAFNLQWIPSKPTQNIESKNAKTNQYTSQSVDNQVEQFLLDLEKNISEFKEYEKNLIEIENLEDEKEYKLILNHPVLSPFAFVWLGLKRVFRFLQRSPRKTSYYFAISLIKLFSISDGLRTFLINSIEVIVYYLNPFNLFEDLYDILMTLLIRFVFPAILTPVILFFPMKNGIILDQAWKIILYIVLVGGLRLGAEFYSLYLRYLANSKLLEEQYKTL